MDVVFWSNGISNVGFVVAAKLDGGVNKTFLTFAMIDYILFLSPLILHHFDGVYIS
jgi:hypothetical protein